MSRPLKEAGFSLNQLDQRVEKLEAGRTKFGTIIGNGGRTLFTEKLNQARDKGGETFVEAVLEVGGRRMAVVNTISNGNRRINERIREIEEIVSEHPATRKVWDIEVLQSRGYIDEADAIPAIDYLRDWVPDAPKEEKSEPEEAQAEAPVSNFFASELPGEAVPDSEIPVADTWLDLGTPAEVGAPEPDAQLSPEDERKEVLKAEFRNKLDGVKIPPIPRSIIEALIDGGFFDEGNLLSRSDLATEIFKDKDWLLEKALASLSVHLDMAKKRVAVAGLSIEGRKPEGAKQVGYFLNVLEPAAPISAGAQEPDGQPSPEEERIAALKVELRKRLNDAKFTPTQKRIIDVLIDGGHLDADSIILKADLANKTFPDKTPEQAFGNLSFQLDRAKKEAAKKDVELINHKPEGAKQVGYFLSFSQPS